MLTGVLANHQVSREPCTVEYPKPDRHFSLCLPTLIQFGPAEHNDVHRVQNAQTKHHPHRAKRHPIARIPIPNTLLSRASAFINLIGKPPTDCKGCHGKTEGTPHKYLEPLRHFHNHNPRGLGAKKPNTMPVSISGCHRLNATSRIAIVQHARFLHPGVTVGRRSAIYVTTSTSNETPSEKA